MWRIQSEFQIVQFILDHCIIVILFSKLRKLRECVKCVYDTSQLESRNVRTSPEADSVPSNLPLKLK